MDFRHTALICADLTKYDKYSFINAVGTRIPGLSMASLTVELLKAKHVISELLHATEATLVIYL